MKKILFTAAALMLLGVAYSTETSPAYPFVMWSKNSIPAVQENNAKVSSAEVVEKIRSMNAIGAHTADKLPFDTMFLIRKEGLTTNSLVDAAKTFAFDREDLISHSMVYLNLEGGFDSETLKTGLNLSTLNQYNMESADEVNVLAEKIIADSVSSTESFKLSLIDIKENVPSTAINSLSQAIQTHANNNLAYVMALTGKQVSAKASPVSLQQTGSTTTDPILIKVK